MAYELHHTRRGPPRHRRESRDDRTNSPTPPLDAIAATSAAAHTRWDQAPRRAGGGRTLEGHISRDRDHTESVRVFQGQTLGKAVEKLLGTYMVLGAKNRGEGIRTRLPRTARTGRAAAGRRPRRPRCRRPPRPGPCPIHLSLFLRAWPLPRRWRRRCPCLERAVTLV